MQQGLNTWFQGERPAPKPLHQEDLYILRASFFHLAELATSQFWLNLHHSIRHKQTSVKYASLIYEPGATKLSFFFKSGPKKALSFSLDVECDQQTHKKILPPIMASISRKSPNKVPITILQILVFAGRLSHKSGALFCWVQRGFYGCGLWEVEMLWVRVMGVTLVFLVLSSHRSHVRRINRIYIHTVKSLTWKANEFQTAKINSYPMVKQKNGEHHPVGFNTRGGLQAPNLFMKKKSDSQL